jgi:hypothetical protein
MATLNGKPPLGYRICTSDRPLGEATDAPADFVELNQTNGNVFKSQGGVWVDGGTFPAELLQAWFANVDPPVEYRIGTSDRPLGETSTAPAGFLVLNTTNGKVFRSQGGVWVDGGTFPAPLLQAWLNA